MKAWIKRSGGLRLEDVPAPTAASDELLVRVEAVSLNRGEVRSAARAADGTIPGWDVAGTVIAGAPNGRGPGEGARVAALLSGGAWAEVINVPAARAAVVPDGVSFEVAATLPIAALTAVRTLDVAGSLLGKRFLVTGGTGGVGQYAIQLGRLAGANVTAISSQRDQWPHLHELGAAEVVAAIDNSEGTYDCILESVGGKSFAQAIERVARGGVVVTIGNSSEEETTFNVRTLYAKGGARIYGLIIFEEVESGRIGARDLERVMSLVQTGALRSSITLRESWTELPSVLAALEQRAYSGKAVLFWGTRAAAAPPHS
jgi:NADPH:quinone reductase-like Zn-dependent oxidoreductase